MTRLRVLSLTGLALWLSVAPGRASSLVLDQAFVPSPIGGGLVIEETQTVAQVFTVGRSGPLAAVDLLVGCCRFGLPEEDLIVELRNTALGIPTTNVLASLTVPPESLAVDDFAFERFDLRPFHLRVRRGDVLALVLSSDAPVLLGGGINPYAWAGEGLGTYEGGLVYVDRGTGFLPTGWDMGFRTYMVPEPAGLMLLGGLLAGAMRARRVRASQ